MSGGISGIKIASEVEEAFAALNKREFAVVILKISKDMQTVEVEKTIKASSGDPQAEWKDVVKLMPESDCRFVISDFSYKDTPTVTKSKIVMIAWSPECAPIKSKMYVPQFFSARAIGVQARNLTPSARTVCGGQDLRVLQGDGGEPRAGPAEEPPGDGIGRDRLHEGQGSGLQVIWELDCSWQLLRVSHYLS